MNKGFDLADRPSAMLVGSFDFIEALANANIFGCAYGWANHPKYHRMLPCVSLVGSNIGGFDAAFKQFKNWGYETDGDAVEIEFALRRDGGYEVWVSPAHDHLVHRILPEPALYEPLTMMSSFIKGFDSTNPLIKDLRVYCDAPIRPVLVGVAIGDPNRPSSVRIRPVEHLPAILKFNLKFHDELTDPQHRMFAVRHRSRFRPPKQNARRKSLKPSEFPDARRKIIDVAFPVLRERIKRAGIHAAVVQQDGYEQVTETQTLQASINLVLSAEMSTPGAPHFSALGKDYRDDVWQYIGSRFDLADSSNLLDHINPSAVGKQVQLDVDSVLSLTGRYQTSIPFPRRQAEFVRKGYVDD